MRKNIFLALDFNSLNKALEITEKTQDHLAGIKIGLELYSSIGLAGIKHFEKFKLPIFLDTKIFDIPNQVAKTIKAKYNARNPKTGGIIYVPEKKKVSFKMSKHLKQEINKDKKK